MSAASERRPRGPDVTNRENRAPTSPNATHGVIRQNERRDGPGAFLQGRVGSAIGFLAGIVLAEAGTAGFRHWSGAGIYPVLHLSTAIMAVGAAVTVGLVFGIYPARRAASLSPVHAIARE